MSPALVELQRREGGGGGRGRGLAGLEGYPGSEEEMINGEKESEGVFSLSLSLIIVHSTKPSRVLSPFLFATFSFQPPSPLPPLSTTSFCISSSTPPPSSSRRIILGLDIIIHPRKTQCDIFLLVNYLCVAFLKLLPPFRRFPFDDYSPSPVSSDLLSRRSR